LCGWCWRRFSAACWATIGSDWANPRVIQGIVTGIGFLGGGAILKGQRGEHIQGLTTAAGLWLTTAVGIAAGLGRELVAILAAGLAFIILSLLRGVEQHVSEARHQSPNEKTEEGPAGAG
jgi:putative Mg2+ transporter-C (MgtC) family protein